MENKARLRYLMVRNGLKAKDVGLMIHRSASTVRHYMCGSRTLPIELMAILEERIKEGAAA